MIMNKITGSMPINGSVAKEDKLRLKEQVSDSSELAAGTTEDDDVVLTATARELGKAGELQQQIPDMDMDKVARIKAQIESGEYQVSAASIAKNLIGIEKLLA